MKILSVLEEKFATAGLDFKSFGEEVISKLNEIEIDDTVGSEFQTKLKTSFLTQLEAENSSSIIDKVKDAEHKKARKATLDSLDSSIGEHINILDNDELKEYSEQDGSVKKNKYLLGKYKEKIALAKSLDTDADKKALEKNLEDYKALVSKDYIPKTDVEGKDKEISEIKNKLKKLEKTTVSDHILSLASRSGILNDQVLQYDKEISDGMIQGAVSKYLNTQTFGIDKVKAKIVLDEASGRVVLRQDSTEDIGVAVDGKILTVDDVVKASIKEYNLHKKTEEKDENIVSFGGVGKPDKGVFMQAASKLWD
jgi:hypothetical protein